MAEKPVRKKAKTAGKQVVIEVVGTDGRPIKAESKKAAVHWDSRLWRRLEAGGSW